MNISLKKLLTEAKEVKIYLNKGDKPPKGKKAVKGPKGGTYFMGTPQEKKAKDSGKKPASKPKVNIFDKPKANVPKTSAFSQDKFMTSIGVHPNINKRKSDNAEDKKIVNGFNKIINDTNMSVLASANIPHIVKVAPNTIVYKDDDLARHNMNVKKTLQKTGKNTYKISFDKDDFINTYKNFTDTAPDKLPKLDFDFQANGWDDFKDKLYGWEGKQGRAIENKLFNAKNDATFSDNPAGQINKKAAPKKPEHENPKYKSWAKSQGLDSANRDTLDQWKATQDPKPSGEKARKPAATVNTFPDTAGYEKQLKNSEPGYIKAAKQYAEERWAKRKNSPPDYSKTSDKQLEMQLKRAKKLIQRHNMSLARLDKLPKNNVGKWVNMIDNFENIKDLSISVAETQNEIENRKKKSGTTKPEAKVKRNPQQHQEELDKIGNFNDDDQIKYINSNVSKPIPERILQDLLDTRKIFEMGDQPESYNEMKEAGRMARQYFKYLDKYPELVKLGFEDVNVYDPTQDM